MKKPLWGIVGVTMLFAIAACSSPENLKVYSSGFSFSKYDYVVVGKPSGDSSAFLYDMDVRLSNVLTEYGMKVVGNEQYKKMPPADQARTLVARMAMNAGSGRIVLAVSFDDAVTGKVGASFTTKTDGDIGDPDDRAQVMDLTTKHLKKALQEDKGLNISG
jgi:hypothetical protein